MPTQTELDKIAAGLSAVERALAVMNLGNITLSERMTNMAVNVTETLREIAEMRNAVSLGLAKLAEAKEAAAAALASQGADQAAVDAITAALDEVAKPLEALAQPTPPAETPPAA